MSLRMRVHDREPIGAALRRFKRLLERSGLIATAKTGRVRTCTLNRERLAVVDGWLAEQRALWAARTDRLERFVTGTVELS